MRAAYRKTSRGNMVLIDFPVERKRAAQDYVSVTRRGFQEFFRSSDNCCALSERSEFAKAVIHRRTKEFRKRKPVAETNPVSAHLLTPVY